MLKERRSQGAAGIRDAVASGWRSLLRPYFSTPLWKTWRCLGARSADTALHAVARTPPYVQPLLGNNFPIGRAHLSRLEPCSRPSTCTVGRADLPCSPLIVQPYVENCHPQAEDRQNEPCRQRLEGFAARRHGTPHDQGNICRQPPAPEMTSVARDRLQLPAPANNALFTIGLHDGFDAEQLFGLVVSRKSAPSKLPATSRFLAIRWTSSTSNRWSDFKKLADPHRDRRDEAWR